MKLHAMIAVGVLVVGGSLWLTNMNAKKLTNEKALLPLEKLVEGNSRFSEMHPQHPDEGFVRLKQVSEAQHPFAAIVTCSDSRVPPELIFDQGLGDLFVIRNAGNIISGVEIGSLEYAVEHLHVPLIIIMGHDKCGAIGAFVHHEMPHGHIKEIMDSIKAEKEIAEISPYAAHYLDKCIDANALHGVPQVLKQSSLIREKVINQSLEIYAARYNFSDGTIMLLK
ncbi:MAG: carbonic anhydrase [Chitinophagaceae bacterium]